MNKYTTWQVSVLVAFRLLIGWHLLYEGIAKLLNPHWTSEAFLRESQWILSGIADFILSNPSLLPIVDFLNTWGLIAIGCGLILGLFARIASLCGAILLLIYYLNVPPLLGIEYTLPSDSNYLIINKTLIEAIGLLVLYSFSTSYIVGLDIFFHRFVKKSKDI
ncbi:DoxX family membrane protein [Bacteroidota bacterium]